MVVGRYDKYGVADQDTGYYDNGFIDPIDFIVHNGPDNPQTRQEEAVPNPIIASSSWFLPLCWQAPGPDARCNMDAYMSYLECTLEKNSLCAVDPSVWSALKSSGQGSGPGGGGGLPPVSGQKPDHVPNFDVYDHNGQEISAKCNNCPTKGVSASQTLSMRLETETHNRDVVQGDLFNKRSQSIDGEIWCRVEGYTDWQEIPGSEDDLEYDVTNLVTKKDSSVERIAYIVPNVPGATLACKSKVDADNEVNEESENNNWSRTERFLIGQPVPPPSPDFLPHGLSAQAVYVGAQANVSYWVHNQGNKDASTDSYTAIEIFNGSWTTLAEPNRVRKDHATAGYDHAEAVTTYPVTLSPGTYLWRVRADHDNRVGESNEGNNIATGSITVIPRPKPVLTMTQVSDDKGCCTTNTGEYVYPKVWVRNDGPAAPEGNVRVLYQISSNGTGGVWWTIGSGIIEPRELHPGDTDEDRMDGERWRIPKDGAWKKQWHTVRACVNIRGGEPTCGDGDSVAAYARYSKK
jgi:hypothetical protein